MPKSVISDTKSRQPRPLFLIHPFSAHYRALCAVREERREITWHRKRQSPLEVTVCFGKSWPTRLAAISQTIRNASTINQRRAMGSGYRSWSSLSSSSSSGAVTNLTVTHLTNNSHGQRPKNLWVTQLATQTIGTAHLTDFRFPNPRVQIQDPPSWWASQRTKVLSISRCSQRWSKIDSESASEIKVVLDFLTTFWRGIKLTQEAKTLRCYQDKAQSKQKAAKWMHFNYTLLFQIK